MKIVKYLAVFLLFVCSIPVNAKTIRFSVVSDINYEISAKKSSETIRPALILDGFAGRMNEENYDFVVFLGNSIVKSKKEHLTGFLNAVKKIKKPYYIVIGNNDSYKYSGVNREDFAKIISNNNRFQKRYKSNYYFYPTPDIIAVFLDSTSMGMYGRHGYFSDDTLKWFDNVLAKNKDKKAIVFQHVPILEPSDNSALNIINKKDYEAVLNKHNNVLSIISGHYRQFGMKQDGKGIYHISVPALSDKPYEYLVIEITYDKPVFSPTRNYSVSVQKEIAL
jgi:predicted phosphodiesterase